MWTWPDHVWITRRPLFTSAIYTVSHDTTQERDGLHWCSSTVWPIGNIKLTRWAFVLIQVARPVCNLHRPRPGMVVVIIRKQEWPPPRTLCPLQFISKTRISLLTKWMHCSLTLYLSEAVVFRKRLVWGVFELFGYFTWTPTQWIVMNLRENKLRLRSSFCHCNLLPRV